MEPISCDTFTWLAKFKDWYRICFGQAPDNLCDEYAEESIPEYFDLDVPPIPTEEEAIKELYELEEGIRKSTEENWRYYQNEYGLIKFDFSNYDIDKWINSKTY